MQDIIIPAGYKERFQAAFRQLQVYMMKHDIPEDLAQLLVDHPKDFSDKMNTVLEANGVAATVYSQHAILQLQGAYRAMMNQVIGNLILEEI